MIIPEIHLIFDLIFDLILFNFRFNFHIGTTPVRLGGARLRRRAWRREAWAYPMERLQSFQLYAFSIFFGRRN